MNQRPGNPARNRQVAPATEELSRCVIITGCGTAQDPPYLIGEALAYVHETDLYPDIQATLGTFWAKERQIEPLAVEITAAQGRKATGGWWTRPDLVSVAVRTYRYLPGKYMEVVTFEVKPSDAITVTAVYEALAHLRSATHTYVIFHVPDEDAELVKQTIEEAHRVELDPERLDEFISVQLSQAAHDRIARALH